MDPDITALVEQAIDALGNPELSAAEIEAAVLALAGGDATLARRLIDVVPEGFGLVLVSHVEPAATLQLPTEFSVQDAAGEWVDFPLTREPVFVAALLAAQRMFHAGPRLKFQTVTDRSGLLQAVNNALNGGQSLEGATLGGPRFGGIPAATYAASADGP
ncbi:hypothetical protein PMI14_00361 [Acidovorax sp. CF316]|uniref:hypothetical protein n=1 Tax=Acidovorax sp. CF316 TaxID=1144317 RepID=UPI00026BED7A|nr:hypothetical protein [Acidovorax sp. CF316]EJE54731.1 hypothetical protein PMI14_00361 [Acidovorax sp. CF316]